MTVIDGLFCVGVRGRTCNMLMRAAYQSSRLTGVRLWAIIHVYTVDTVVLRYGCYFGCSGELRYGV